MYHCQQSTDSQLTTETDSQLTTVYSQLTTVNSQLTTVNSCQLTTIMQLFVEY